MTVLVDTAALDGHLRSLGVPVAGPLTAELVAGGRSNLTYRLSDGVHRWVFRRPPAAGQTASAHDVAREARVTGALQKTDVPVPPVISLCEDLAVIGAPFTITTWIDGEVIRERSELDRVGDEDLRRATASMIDVLATLHEVDPYAVGLTDFGRPQGFVERQVALWRRQWEQVKTRELADLERLHSLLEQRLPISTETAVLHGDFRIDNLILDPLDPARVLAVLDWELSTLGEPRTDVALMCAYRNPALDAVLGIPAAWASPRLASAQDMASAYVDRSGRDLGDWGFYLGLAHLKLAVIAEGIAYRAMAGADAGRNARAAADAVPELVASGLACVTG
ncbi:phosphotransferase family protein [Nocardioides sp. NPDC051685]|uniref:phosphotransferase family protein n=1 Tax=Nocardioides sp. NPDC051685 TaxID=3364334 RepID=UPI0037BD9C2B